MVSHNSRSDLPLEPTTPHPPAPPPFFNTTFSSLQGPLILKRQDKIQRGGNLPCQGKRLDFFSYIIYLPINILCTNCIKLLIKIFVKESCVFTALLLKFMYLG